MSAEPVTPRSLLVVAVLAQLLTCVVVGAVVWAAWLGWDHTYYYDGATGAQQGPYRPAQVIACAATVGLVTALLALWWRPLVVAAGVTLGFWTLWTVQAAHDDSSGLYVVGSVLLLAGLAIGTPLAGAVGRAARRLVRP